MHVSYIPSWGIQNLKPSLKYNIPQCRNHRTRLSWFLCGLFLDTIALPPSSNAPVNLVSGHPIAHQAKRDTQLCLNVTVARLVIEEQHILISHIARLLNFREMRCLIPGIDLDEIEVVKGTDGLSVRGGVIGEGGDDMQGFEHVARQIGGLGSGCKGQWNRAMFTGVNYR